MGRFKRVSAVLGVVFVAWLGLGLWLWPTVDTAPPRARVVFAASSGVGFDSLLDDLGHERLTTAIRVAASSKAAHLYTSRVWMWFYEWEGTSTDYGQRRIIDSAGLADRWTILSDTVNSTRDEALFLRRQVPDSAVVVVTSRLHTRRACAVFRKVGFTVTCLASGWDGPFWKLPYRLAYELAAFAKYRRLGWL